MATQRTPEASRRSFAAWSLNRATPHTSSPAASAWATGNATTPVAPVTRIFSFILRSPRRIRNLFDCTVACGDGRYGLTLLGGEDSVASGQEELDDLRAPLDNPRYSVLTEVR